MRKYIVSKTKKNTHTQQVNSTRKRRKEKTKDVNEIVKIGEKAMLASIDRLAR